VTGSQIWLNPLLDDCQITYNTNLKKEKEKEKRKRKKKKRKKKKRKKKKEKEKEKRKKEKRKKKKKKDLPGCGNDSHFMVDGINIARDLKMGRGTGGRSYDGP